MNGDIKVLKNRMKQLKVWVSNNPRQNSNKTTTSATTEKPPLLLLPVSPSIKRSNSDNCARAKWNASHIRNNSLPSEEFIKNDIQMLTSQQNNLEGFNISYIPTQHGQQLGIPTTVSPPRTLKKSHTISSAESNSIGPYKILKTIGVGSFSIVKLGCGVTNTQSYQKEYVALKMIKKSDDDEGVIRKAVDDEVRIIKLITPHPNIVPLLDLVENNKYITMVLPYYPNGDLFDFTLNHHNKLTRNSNILVKLIFQQILLAVQHMHSKKICHRDLKIENVLICFDINIPPTSFKEGMIKLTDFGLSHSFNTTNIPRLGSDEYISPEIILSSPNVDPQKIDVWALGVILFTLLVGNLPFAIDDKIITSRRKLYHKISSGEYEFPSNDVLIIPDGVKLLVEKMLCFDVVKRIGIDEVLANSWLNDLSL